MGQSRVTVTDQGNGNCLFTSDPVLGIPSSTCGANVFRGVTCGYFYGTIELVFQNRDNRTAQRYVPADFNKWLTNLGLNGISYAVALVIRIETPLAGPIPPGLNTNVLPHLLSVFDLLITGTQAYSATQIGISTLALLRLQQVLGKLSIIGTSLPDLRIFSTLVCGPGQLAGSITILNNAAMTSLDGFSEVLGPPPGSPVAVQSLFIDGNGNLQGARTLQGLSSWLQCPSDPAGQTSISQVQVKLYNCFAMDYIQRVDTLCQYIKDTWCPSLGG
eukprot:jgi/Botrbrau1/6350/Bobra.0098s0009.1